MVLQDADADGTIYKCDVTLKLSRKTTVDVIAGRYDVIGYKRGNKPYKKFRDSGMIEVKLLENVMQSEVLDVSADVEQPQPEKEAKKKKGKKIAALRGQDGQPEDDDDDVRFLMEDMMSIVTAGIDDYASGVAFLLISDIIVELEAIPKATQTIGVFMEGPLIDMRALPWELEAKMQANRATNHTIHCADATRVEYDFISVDTTTVAEVVDALIAAVEEPHGALASCSTKFERPMSSGLVVSLVMETLLQAVETGGGVLQSHAPRMRFEGPLIDLRSLPWESQAKLNPSYKFDNAALTSAHVSDASVVSAANMQSEQARVDMCDLTLESEP